MDAIYLILGLVMIYSTGHFLVIQHWRGWEHRTSYERVVTIVATISIVCTFLSVMVNG
jgi:hypothetical protein